MCWCSCWVLPNSSSIIKINLMVIYLALYFPLYSQLRVLNSSSFELNWMQIKKVLEFNICFSIQQSVFHRPTTVSLSIQQFVYQYSSQFINTAVCLSIQQSGYQYNSLCINTTVCFSIQQSGFQYNSLCINTTVCVSIQQSSFLIPGRELLKVTQKQRFMDAMRVFCAPFHFIKPIATLFLPNN